MAKKRKGTNTVDTVSTLNPGESSAPPASQADSMGTNAKQSGQSNAEILSSAISIQEKVALLAYSYWQERGCRGGSSEEDWFRAEREVLSRLSASAK